MPITAVSATRWLKQLGWAAGVGDVSKVQQDARHVRSMPIRYVYCCTHLRRRLIRYHDTCRFLGGYPCVPSYCCCYCFIFCCLAQQPVASYKQQLCMFAFSTSLSALSRAVSTWRSHSCDQPNCFQTQLFSRRI